MRRARIAVWLAVGLWAFSLLAAGAARASCLNAKADSRLQALCLTDQAQRQVIDLRTAQAIDLHLKREGSARGLGLPGTVAPQRFDLRVYPALEWAPNINGGNPDRPLVLGDLVLTGAPERLRNEGFVAGLGAGARGRSLLGPGRYVDHDYGAVVTGSARHDAAIRRAWGGLCAKVRVVPRGYVDACASASRTRRTLTTENQQAVSLAGVRLWGGEARYHQASAGLRRSFFDDYAQHQAFASVETLRLGGVFTRLGVTLGQPVRDRLAQRQGAVATLGTTLAGRALTLTLGYGHSDGGRLLGVARRDTTLSAGLSYVLHPRVQVRLGYRSTDSSIDYYDAHEPVVAFDLAPLRF